MSEVAIRRENLRPKEVLSQAFAYCEQADNDTICPPHSLLPSRVHSTFARRQLGSAGEFAMFSSVDLERTLLRNTFPLFPIGTFPSTSCTSLINAYILSRADTTPSTKERLSSDARTTAMSENTGLPLRTSNNSTAKGEPTSTMGCAYCSGGILNGLNPKAVPYGPANGTCTSCNISYNARGRMISKQRGNADDTKARAKEHHEELTGIMQTMRTEQGGGEALRKGVFAEAYGLLVQALDGLDDIERGEGAQ